HSSTTDKQTTISYPLSLHDALPISMASMKNGVLRSVNDTFRKITRVVSTRGIMSGETMKDRLQAALNEYAAKGLTAYTDAAGRQDRKSTRLNSSHVSISYAVFCLKK